MKLINETCENFTALIASTAPAPGGGGASALVGAVAAALGDMVGELTLGKPKYAEVEPEIKGAMKEAQELRVKLLELVDRDAQDFEPLAAAYAIPKDEPGRDEELERCLRLAAQPPLEIFKCLIAVIELQKIFAEKGSKLMISDAATGAALARGALLGAAVNVKVNTKLMKDREYAEEINSYIDDRLSFYCALADEIFEGIWEKY